MKFVVALAWALAACAPKSSRFPLGLCGTGSMSAARAQALRAAAKRVGLTPMTDGDCAGTANGNATPTVLPVFDPRAGRPLGAARLLLQSYDAVLGGAAGLLYSVPSEKDAVPPDQWRALRFVADRMNALRPILAGGRPEPLPFGPRPDGLRAHAWRYHGRDYVVIADLGSDSLKLPAELMEPRWRLLFERRRDVRDIVPFAGDGWYMAPDQVLVFESRLSVFGLIL